MATLTPAQVAQAWVQGGGPASVAGLAVAYAWIESGYSPAAHSPTGCVGLWQICGTSVTGDLTDPAVNARAAVAKWKACQGGSFDCDWTPYDFGPANPGWAKGLADGQAAMAALGSPGSSAAPAAQSTSTSDVTGFGATVAGALASAEQALTGTALGVALAALGALVLGVALYFLLPDGARTAVRSSMGGAGRAALLAAVHV